MARCLEQMENETEPLVKIIQVPPSNFCVDQIKGDLQYIPNEDLEAIKSRKLLHRGLKELII